MKWYWKLAGAHTHVKVFMNGAHCGALTFRNDEFTQVREHCPWIQFIEENTVNTVYIQDMNQS